jgi:hypothetical protein
MELLPYTEDDLALTEATECDPEMMRELRYLTTTFPFIPRLRWNRQ